MKVRVSARARREFERCDAWWRSNRDASDLLTREVLDVPERLRDNPDLGAPYEAEDFKTPVRRISMPKCEHRVYHARVGDLVVVLAVWGARRRHGPKL